MINQNEYWRRNAQRALLNISNMAPRLYSTRDFGRKKYWDAYSVILPHEDAYMRLPMLRENLDDDLVAFVGTTRWYGNEQHDGIELVVGEGESQFDMLLIAATHAPTFDLATGDIVKRLQQYDFQYGIDIIQAEADAVQFILKALPANVLAFTADLCDFCPDICDSGDNSLQELSEIIEESGQVSLWWD